MRHDEIDLILGAPFPAEQQRDTNLILTTYTDDIEHVPWAEVQNPIRGKAAIDVFYREFLADLEHARVIPVRRLYGDDFVVDDRSSRAYDLERYGRPVRFRVLHLFEFRDGLISRENAWLDMLAVQRQLAPARHG